MSKKDNAGYWQKVQCRREALGHVDGPLVVLEAFGGWGRLGDRLYQDAAAGVVLEKNEEKAAHLCSVRPAWRVYEGDSESLVRAGAGHDLAVNFVDMDPYGDPWPVIEAFFESDRERPSRVVVAVNDGLPRGTVRIGNAWRVKSLNKAVEKFGPRIHSTYLDVAKWNMNRIAEAGGYSMKVFKAMWAHRKNIAHYYAVLDRPA